MSSKSMIGLVVSALVLIGSSVLSGCHSDASCGDVCKHDLGCAGLDTSDVSKCVTECEQSKAATPEFRNKRVVTDCAALPPVNGATGNNGVTGNNADPTAGADPYGVGDPNAGGDPIPDPGTSSGDPSTSSSSGSSGGCYPDGHTCSAGGDCCNGNCIDMSVNQWICY